MAKYYFFTDPALLSAQSGSEAFGPVAAAAGNDRFHVTDRHVTSTNGAPAIALCDAQVCAQSVDANTLTLILKPKVQPPFDFPFICYVLYKGIDRASLLNANGEVDATLSDNALVRVVEARAQAANSSLSSDWLGLDLAGGPLDDLFYRADPQYAPPQVRGGDKIGAFTQALGVEIVIERMGQRPSANLAQQSDAYLTVASLAPGADASATFLHWHDKEKALAFVDPCAFWSAFRAAKLRVWSETGKKFDAITGPAVYETVLRGVHDDSVAGAYFNRNRAYIDIRDEHSHSINYYKADGPEIQATLDPAADLDAGVVDYYRSGWPCFWLEDADLPAGAAGDKAALRFALPRTETTRPLLYVSVGDVDGGGKLKDAQRFIQRARRADQPFLEEAQLYLPLRTSGGQARLVSSYQRLHRFKRPIVVDGVARTPSDPNSLLHSCAPGRGYYFPTPLLSELPAGTAQLQFKFYDDLFFVNVWTRHGHGFVARVGLGRDADNVVLMMAPVAHDASTSVSAPTPVWSDIASFARVSDAIAYALAKSGGEYDSRELNDPANPNTLIDILQSGPEEASMLVASAQDWPLFLPTVDAIGDSAILQVENAGALVSASGNVSTRDLTLEFLETVPVLHRRALPIPLAIYTDAALSNE